MQSYFEGTFPELWLVCLASLAMAILLIINIMNTGNKRAFTYRQFSKRKLIRHRHMFPRMRESEAVSKVIKQWESLSQIQKDELYREYRQQKKKREDDSPEQQESQSIDLKVHVPRFQVPKFMKTTGVKVYVASSQQSQKENSDFEEDKKMNYLEISESQSIIGKPLKFRKPKDKIELKPTKKEVQQLIAQQFQQVVTNYTQVMDCVIRLKKIDPDFIVIIRGTIIQADLKDFTYQETQMQKQQETLQKQQEQGEFDNVIQSKIILDILYDQPSKFKKVVQKLSQQQKNQNIQNAIRKHAQVRKNRVTMLMKRMKKQHPKWSILQVLQIAKLHDLKMFKTQKKLFDQACQKIYKRKLQVRTKALCGKYVFGKFTHQKRCSKCRQQKIYVVDDDQALEFYSKNKTIKKKKTIKKTRKSKASACQKIYKRKLHVRTKALCGKYVFGKFTHQKRCSKCRQQKIYVVDDQAIEFNSKKKPIQEKTIKKTRKSKASIKKQRIMIARKKLMQNKKA